MNSYSLGIASKIRRFKGMRNEKQTSYLFLNSTTSIECYSYCKERNFSALHHFRHRTKLLLQTFESRQIYKSISGTNLLPVFQILTLPVFPIVP